jgi:hypothetical protein
MPVERLQLSYLLLQPSIYRRVVFHSVLEPQQRRGTQPGLFA